MRELQQGVWQMSLAMVISGSIGRLCYFPACRLLTWFSGAA